MTAETVWPEPAEEPIVEHGEDVITHLLPNSFKLAGMTPADRLAVLQAVDDWDGPMVEAWRRAVSELEADES